MAEVSLRARANNAYGSGDWSEPLVARARDISILLGDDDDDDDDGYDEEGGSSGSRRHRRGGASSSSSSGAKHIRDPAARKAARNRQRLEQALESFPLVRDQSARALQGLKTVGVVRGHKDRSNCEAGLRRAHKLADTWLSRCPAAEALTLRRCAARRGS